MLTTILVILALIIGGIAGTFATAIACARTIDNLTGQRDALRRQIAQRDLALAAATHKDGENE